MKHFVISYDISDDAKRGKVSSLLEDHGQRVQYSVFECRLDEKALDKLTGKLQPFAEGSDSIRIYQICEACLKKVVLLGNATVSEERRFFVV